jgi:hypothetical protein
MALPKLDQPIQIEGPPRKLPEIGRLNLADEGIDVLIIFAFRKQPHALCVEARHDDDDSFFRRWW